MFDGQEHISSLEADRSWLEGERGSLQQANEALTRKCVPRGPSPLELPLGWAVRPQAPSTAHVGPIFQHRAWEQLEGQRLSPPKLSAESVHITCYICVSTGTMYCVMIIQANIMISCVLCIWN